MLRIFISRSARTMRTAISPRLATRTLANMHGDFNRPRPGFTVIEIQYSNCMDHEEFRRYGHQVVDWIGDYLEDIRQYPVLPDMKPGT